MLHLFSNKIYSLLFTAFVASVLFALFFLFLPKIEKYQINLVSSVNTLNKEFFIYHDINSDGTSEGFNFIANNSNGLSHYVFYKNGKQLYQHNPMGKFFNEKHYCFGDFDHDKRKELYLFWYRNDSLFVNVILAETEALLAENVFITTITFDQNNLDSHVENFHFTDVDGDGFDELFINLGCGFSVTNRKNILYNIRKNEISISPSKGIVLYHSARFLDISGDGIPEIFGDRKSHGNTKPDYFLSDQKLWLTVPDVRHNELFPPKYLGEYPGTVFTTPVFSDKTPMIAAFCVDFGEDYDSTNLAVYNTSGDLARKINLPYKSSMYNSILTGFPESHPENLRLVHSDGKITEYNCRLEEIGSRKILPFIDCWKRIDIDGDGEEERILQGTHHDLFITRNDFSHAVRFEPDEFISLLAVSVMEEKGKPNQLSLSTDRYQYVLDYSKNPLYTYRIVIFIVLWFSLFSFLHYTGRFYQKIAVKKYESEKQLAHLQVSALEKQLTPHFNLNILNSIGALYENHEISQAQYYMGKYSKLLRNLLIRSGKIAVTVEEELEFTRDYLELEKLRMNHLFEYTISGEEEFLEVQIPKMLIHTFCENAIKHGIRHLEQNGRLEIAFSRQKNLLKILVSDNGIGREKSRQYSQLSTGKGLKILNQTLDLFFQLKQIRINYSISDIYDERKTAKGVRVDIQVPLKS